MKTGLRICLFIFCVPMVAELFVLFGPHRGFGMPDDQFALIAGTAGDAAIVLTLLNALLAIGLMTCFREARERPWLSGVLWAVVVIGILLPAFAPAIQTS